MDSPAAPMDTYEVASTPLGSQQATVTHVVAEHALAAIRAQDPDIHIWRYKVGGGQERAEAYHMGGSLIATGPVATNDPTL